MSVKYDQDTRAKAIRLVREHADDCPSKYAAITAIARRLGMTPEVPFRTEAADWPACRSKWRQGSGRSW